MSNLYLHYIASTENTRFRYDNTYGVIILSIFPFIVYSNERNITVSTTIKLINYFKKIEIFFSEKVH